MNESAEDIASLEWSSVGRLGCQGIIGCDEAETAMRSVTVVVTDEYGLVAA